MWLHYHSTFSQWIFGSHLAAILTKFPPLGTIVERLMKEGKSLTSDISWVCYCIVGLLLPLLSTACHLPSQQISSCICKKPYFFWERWYLKPLYYISKYHCSRKCEISHCSRNPRCWRSKGSSIVAKISIQTQKANLCFVQNIITVCSVLSECKTKW